MVNRRRLLYFVMFIGGVTLFFSGVLGWVVFADQDYSITYERKAESPAGVSNGALDVGNYDGFNEQQRADFQRAVNGSPIHYETDENVWPEAIRKDGMYYVFSVGSSFDWMNPMTFGPALAAVVGIVIGLQAALWEHRLY